MSDLPFATSDKRQAVKIRLGPGAKQKPRTVTQNFDDIVKKYPNKPALHQKIVPPGGSAGKTKWTTWTWSEYRKQVDSFSKSLISIGFQKFDTVNIIGFNAPEWHFSNFGAMLAGGIAAGIYSSNLPEACQYISEHSEAKVVVCEGLNQLEKFYEISAELPNLKALVMYGPEDLPEDVRSKVSVPVYKFEDFLKLGAEVEDTELKARSDGLQPGEVSALIYTSGTTGPPKAVMITNDNITWTTNEMVKTLPRIYNNNDHIISYLPLSHIAAQIVDMHVAMATGLQIWFAQPDALRGSLGTTLKEVRPTAFLGVPRVWEKIYDKMQQVAKETTGIKKKISTWAKGKATVHWENHQFGGNQRSPMFLGLSRKLLGKVRVALGLDRCDVCNVAAAPIDNKILNYFASVDIPILEVFGQSECTGPHTVNTTNAWKIGTVGRPFPGTVTRIDPNNGELMYSGRHIFAGYMGMEDKTQETIDADGFMHSGDVVKIDNCLQGGVENTGFVTITGRIKELIITAGGENVPPVLIEEHMKNAMPALANCMVIGDKRKFLSILLCLAVEIGEDGLPTNKLTGEALATSQKIGSKATTNDEAVTCEKWKKYFDNGVAAANEKSTSRAQRVAKWSLLTTDFSEPGGELTPTLKLKRSVAADIHSEAIEAFYA